jgi:O-antigen/teichoic acid export membrane protein
MHDLKQKAIRGAFAKVWSQAALFVFRIGSLMVLARLLEPRDFGLVAMVTVITGVFRLFQDAGLSLVTVQRSNITKDQVSTLFWMNILVGSILCLLMFVSAPLLVSFYQEPRLLWITIALASGFFINAAGVQHAALLQRHMRFTTLAWIEVLSFLLGAVIGIGMAMGGLGYWALVANTIVPTIVATTCYWMTERWVPGPPRRDAGNRSMFGFGGKVTLNGIILYFSLNLDKVLLGRSWGTEVLGIYGRAYQLIMIPRDYISAAVGGVAVASLSRLHDDPPRFRSYFLKSYSLMQALLMPVTLATALFADEIILFFLGPVWKDAGVVLRLLTPTILVMGLVSPLNWFLYASGALGRCLRMSFVFAPLLAAAYFVGLPYGPRGVALALSSVMVAWTVPAIAWCFHRSGIPLKAIFQTISQPVVSALVAGTFTLGLKLVLGSHLSSFVRLLIGTAVLFIIHVWMLLYVMRQKAFYLDLIRSLLKRPPASPEPGIPMGQPPRGPRDL